MRARRFEDLYFWQKARELAKVIYRITSNTGFEKDPAFRDLFRQLSHSVMGEIAYGFAQARGSDFKDSLDISRGDMMRIKALSYLAKDLGCLTDEELEEIHVAILDVDRIMMGFIRGMRSRQRETSGDRGDREHNDRHSSSTYGETSDGETSDGELNSEDYSYEESNEDSIPKEEIDDSSPMTY